MGACVITPNAVQSIGGGLRVSRGILTLSTSYATGGETIATANLGLTAMYMILHDFHRDGLLFAYSYNANKMQAFYPQGINAPAGTGIGAMTYTTLGVATGVGVMSSQSNPAVNGGVMTAGAGLEVQATVDLSGKVLSYIAFGY